MSKPEQSHSPVARPAELEDWLNAHLYHPLSFRLARLLQSTPITPNVVSIIGGLMVVAAAGVYLNLPGVLGGILGLLVHMGWHVLDGADGDLARLTGRASETGEIIDGVCDYAGHLVLYITLAVMWAADIGWIGAGWIGAGLVVAAGLARVVQAIFFETQRRQYQFWVYGVPWLRMTSARYDRPARAPILAPARLYLRLSSVLSNGGERLDRLLDGMAPDERLGAQATIKKRLIPTIRRLPILSANYRTLVIGAAMIVGEPMIFVVFELAVLNIVLLVFWRQAQRAIAALAVQLSAKIDR